MTEYKKAISPVIAAALLLVVAVAAVVGFQNWMSTYSSSTYSDVDEKSSTHIMSSKIENIIGNNLYFDNKYDNLTIQTIYVGNNPCNVTGNYSKGILELPVATCIENVSTSSTDVIITTDKGVFTKKIYLKKKDNSISISNSFEGIYQWNRTFSSGQDAEAYDMKLDNNDNIYLTGWDANSSWDYNIVTVKYDSNGNLIWNRTYLNNGKGGDSIIIDNTNNVLYTGGSSTLLKYDFDGNLIWNKTLSTGSASDLAIDTNHNIYTSGGGVTNKLDSDGNLIFNISYAGEIDVDNSNNLYIGRALNDDYFYKKYNSSGVELFNRTYAAGTWGNVKDLKIDRSDNVVITGDILGPKAVTVKYDSSGNFLWNQTYPGGKGFGIGIDDSNKDIFVTGQSDNGEILSIQYDSDGNKLWNSSFLYPEGASNWGNAIEIDSKKNVYVAGEIYDSDWNWYYGLLKYS